MGTTCERVGQRVYLAGLPFAAKDRAKAIGCHWDADRRQWWIGAKKSAAVEALAAELNAGVFRPTPASERAAGAVGLDASTPAAVVADRLADEGREGEAAAVRASETREQIDAMRVYAAVDYRGRRYYVVAETRDLTRCRITTLDAEAPRWVDCADCTLVRRYEGHQKWNGLRYPSNRTVTVYPTVGSLRRYRDQQRQGERNGLPACSVCGKRSNDLVHDLETGLLACRGCADMPAD